MCLHLEKETPQEKELTDYVTSKFASKWEKLGRQLNIKEDLLKNIQKDNPNDYEGCCNKMLSGWLDTTTNPSWEIILNATDKLITDQNTDNG